MILDLLQIAIITTAIIDHTDIIDSIKGAIAKWLRKSKERITIKPFECSLCTTWWCCLSYITFTGHFTITNLMLCILMAVSTKVISNAIYTVQDLFIWMTNKINKITRL